MIIVTMESVRKNYMRIMATEERLAKRQQERDSRELDAEVWIVHDKDDGSVVSAASTKTMAIKRAHVYRGHAWLDTDRYSLRCYEITPKEEH